MEIAAAGENIVVLGIKPNVQKRGMDILKSAAPPAGKRCGWALY